MKNLCKILSILILCLGCAFSASSAPQQLQMQNNSSNDIVMPSTTLLKGGVQCVQELPQGMYGMWQVRGTLVETNNGNKYISNSSDVWVLRKDGDYVTLINPKNGARATITVTEVQNNTATFERTVKNSSSTDTEHVTISLNGNSFVGTDLIISKYYGGYTCMAKYRLHGDKIMGQTIYDPKPAVHF